MDPLRGEYGFLTQFAGLSEQEARNRVQDMYTSFGVLEFQFYDAFEGYSSPPQPHKASWTNKAREIITGQKDPNVDRAILKAYISEIDKLGGRSWLYVQAMGCDRNDTAARTLDCGKLLSCSGSHEAFLDAVVLTEEWARRFAPQWAIFAKSLGFSGIHWDTLGNHGKDADGKHQSDLGCDVAAFLRAALPLLREHGVAQTCNFVDGFGWDKALYSGIGWSKHIVAFPYWEVWTVPDVEEQFFAAASACGGGAVFVCYPGQSETHEGERQNMHARGRWPFDLIIDRWNKARQHRCTYLAIGDGCRHIRNEYFPNTSGISDEGCRKLQKSVFAASG
eukprot:TRINITY_DN6639_c1_g1_i1.p1 TRINITY_DN6639_c1_g1~~TRINITY_DN6639_c1_g1_i1.p1  ORF type:complete len:335 (-),score=25.60 TRINITY_DN6639_c1_g1_i1:332-1336(-)